MKNISLILLAMTVHIHVMAQTPTEQTVTFRFVSGSDVFYIPWGGNDTELNRLYVLVDEYRTEIIGGKIPIYVDGYCASMPTAKENLNTAFIRASRVKSELITHKGLLEEHFVTTNQTTAYEGHKDMVVVTLRIPAKAEEPKPRPAKKEEPKPVVKPEPQPEPVAEPEQEPVAIEPQKPAKPYCFAVRTNLLYDAFLLPTLGVEWRINPNVGIKVDGSRSWWGSKHGKAQKIWLVNPEARWYMGGNKRFYVGAAASFGEYNVYKYMIGSLKSDDTGYQGKLWNAGLTVGYQLYLSRGFSVDFNLGLGYTAFDYDTFGVTDGVRLYKEKDKTKDFFGPTQAGISLIWTIGGSR